MGPLAKRPRLASLSDDDDDDDDELNFEPDEVSQRRDPGYRLQKERAFAANRLKSTFEFIFEKYERDFTEVGDEIDLRTGEIVVNNGHLQSMRNEKDIGGDFEEDEGILLSEMYGPDSDGEDRESPEDDTRTAVRHDEGAEGHDVPRGPPASTHPSLQLQPMPRKKPPASRHAPLPTPIRLATQNRLASLGHSRYTPLKPSPLSSGAWDTDESQLEPAWRAPPLLRASLPPVRTPDRGELYYQLPATDGTHSVWASGSSDMRWPSSSHRPRAKGPMPSSSPTRRLLPLPPGDDDEDEILVGDSTKVAARREGIARSGASTETKKSAAPGTEARSRKLKSTGTFIKPGPQAIESSPKTPQAQTRKAGPRTPSHQTLVVAIPFKKPPEPESLTIVDDTSPLSIRSRASSATPTPLALEEPLYESSPKAPETDTGPISSAIEQPSVPPVPSSPPFVVAVSVSDDKVAATHQESPLPVEPFFRNEIDPSYEFSDEDELPPRVPVESLPSAPPEADVPPEPRLALKQKPRRLGGARKRKLGSTEPPAIESTVPSRPSRRPAEEQEPLPAEPVIGESDGNNSPEDDGDLLDLQGAGDAQDLPEVHIASPIEDLPMVDASCDETLAHEAPHVGLPDLDADAQIAAIADLSEKQDTDVAHNKLLRDVALIAPTDANIPSPVRSDDSLGLALDAIIASQRLFDDSDRNPDTSPAKPADESPTRHVLAARTSARKRRRSVHFLEEEVRDDGNRPKIVSTPPLRKASSQPGESHQDAAAAPEDEPSPEHRPLPANVIDLTASTHEDPPSSESNMFAAHKARRRRGGSRTSSPSHRAINTLKSSRQPAVKRRSLLSIALAESDDEDPLSAMSLLTTWTRDAPGTPRAGQASTPSGSRRRTGGDSTVRKRIAREGFGGLSTPTRRHRALAASSPTGSVICTPGGHARRCGVDGFRCDRDFCFTCLDG